MKKFLELRVLLVVVMVSFSACKSQFVEKKPDVNLGGSPDLQLRLDQKIKLDKKLDEIEAAAERLQNLYAAFKKVVYGSDSGDVYTPIDFVLAVHDELAGKMPLAEKGGGYVRKGNLDIPIQGLSPECRRVDLQLSSGGKSIGEIDTMELGMKTCSTKDQYLPVITATWSGATTDLVINNDQLNRILLGLATNSAIQESKCKINLIKDNEIDSVICQDMLVKINDVEYVIINKAGYFSNGDIEFSVEGTIYEDSKAKRIVTVEFYRGSDKPPFKIRERQP